MKQVRFMIILIALDKKLKRCQQIEIKKIIKILNIVNKIVNFNEQNQQGSGVKTLNQVKCLVDYRFL